MKKIGLIVLTLVLTVSLCACGRNKPAETIPATVAPTTLPTETTTMPTIDPTMGTNIPDPTVESNSQDMLDPSDSTNNTENKAGDNTRNQGMPYSE